MEFQILGPIAVHDTTGAVALGGNKPRAVLAVLLLHPNEPVSAERLALALWGEDAPGGAVKTVQVHVSRLRKALGDPDAVTTSAAGYTLRVRTGELDVDRFEGLVEDGRQALADGRTEDAATFLRDALAVWRGPALAELAQEPFAAAEIARLEAQRLAALELRIEADLGAGRHAEVVGELQQLVVANPIREELAAQLMLALYRCGRQAEALEAYAQARATLVEELGIEPGPRLREMQEAILRQDVALEAERAEPELPPALDPTNAQPLAGRAAELAWLQARWEDAAAGAGALVALEGPGGIGKSRLVAELAQSVRRPGVVILHATGEGPADTTLVALRRLRDAKRPTLLVVDDVDRAGAGVQTELARLGPRLKRSPVLVVACARDPLALAGLPVSATLALAPLEPEEVREIAARYAPARSAADVPVGWLVEASGGVPRRAHELSSQWARREAARRVGAVADRAEAGREQLRSIQDELTGDVEALQAADERLARAGQDDARIVCPYKGLASFDVADAALLLRPRAPRRRARRAPRRGHAARRRRPVGQRQVLGAARRPAAGAGERRAAGQRALGAGAHPARRAPAARARAGARRRRGARADRHRRRPVRGDVHQLHRRGGARGVHRRARVGDHRSRRALRRADGAAGGLLRALRRLHGAVQAAGLQPRPRPVDAARRAAPRGRAPRGARRPARGPGAHRRARRGRPRGARRAPAAADRAARAVAAPRRAAHALQRVRGVGRRARGGRAARRGRVRPARRAPAGAGARRAHALGERRRERGRRAPAGAAGRARDRLERGARARRRAAHRPPPADGDRRLDRARARGAAARVAAAARLGRGEPRRPADPPRARQRRARVAGARPRRGRAVSRHAPDGGVGVGGREP